MIRRSQLNISRRKRRGREPEFGFVLSFAAGVARRRKPRPRPFTPRPAPVSPRPLLGTRLTIAEPPQPRPSATAPARVRELEDA